MRSTTFFASALAFAASALAQTAGYAVMTSPAEGQQVPSGKTFTIKWEAGSFTGPATISLLGGATPSTLVPGPVLATVDVTEGSFAWNVECSLGKEKTYGIKITSVADEKTFQYSFPFAIAGPSCSSGAGQYPTLSSSTSVSISSSSSSSSVSSSSTKSSSVSSYPTLTSETSSISISTSTPIYVSTKPGNLSSTAAPTSSYAPTTIITSTSAVVSSVPTGSATTSAPVSVPTSAAGNVVAGSFALIGGLAIAALAL
ncbi:Ser-Thr-rich glycosyl-phosphatidyl-inositol-anchored membrane family-domain-containing protein [Hypomontagnella submonticulosa]|nr:Ser-Thr-rich glycosyl-phosphatidyl-inositol-anchored membrane family-domain-containing protein [Hypomontagnella submonticulosa]